MNKKIRSSLSLCLILFIIVLLFLNSIENFFNQNNKPDVVKRQMNNYDSLYTVDFNFDDNVNDLNEQVISRYITRVLNSHPYNVQESQIVDLIVSKDKKKISVVVSNKHVRKVNPPKSIHIMSNNRTKEMTNNVISNDNLRDLNNQFNDKMLTLINNKGESHKYSFNKFQKPISVNHIDTEIIDLHKEVKHYKNSNNRLYYSEKSLFKTNYNYIIFFFVLILGVSIILL